jgi:dephospho-CoA kinase
VKATGQKLVVGIVGGVGSGKSTVARELERLGATVVSGDEAGHRALGREEVKQEVRRRWGEVPFGPDGEIDRSKLAAIVFTSSPTGHTEREALERLVHPVIEAELHAQIKCLQQDPAVPLIVVDAAVLLEAGWDQAVDRIVFVEAPRRTRLERVRAARQWDEAELDSRENAQISLSLKRQRADYVVDNSGSPDQTLRQIERIYSTLTEDPPA